jgi:hypothetical protein
MLLYVFVRQPDVDVICKGASFYRLIFARCIRIFVRVSYRIVGCTKLHRAKHGHRRRMSNGLQQNNAQPPRHQRALHRRRDIVQKERMPIRSGVAVKDPSPSRDLALNIMAQLIYVMVSVPR